MLLHEVTSFLPPSVLAIQAGRFFAELAYALKKLLDAKHPQSFHTVTMDLDSQQPRLSFFMTLPSVGARPPHPRPAANLLLKKHKLERLRSLGLITYDTVREDETSWSLDINVDLRDFVSEDELDAFCNKAAKIFQDNLTGTGVELNAIHL